MKMSIEIAKLHVLVLAVLSVQDKTSPLDKETLGVLLKRVCLCLCQHGEILNSINRITWLALIERKNAI